ncbi:MAG: hypothetical protein HN337_08020 [Deltaproteobacteria bacterium]|jgi:FAD:protein FMN transferase|nr:hypothetical protein [Deltaproteobacteria bacterium]
MISNKNGARRLQAYKVFASTLLSLLILISTTRTAIGGGIEQYQRHATIGGRIPVSIIIVGWSKDKKTMEKLFDVVLSKINTVHTNLNWANAQSEVSRVNANAGKGPVTVSSEVLAAFQAAKKVSGWTDGAFDITYYQGPGSYRDIAIDKSNYTVELKTAGMRVNFDKIIDGFLADVIVHYVYHANMHNAMVKVGSIFRGIGNGMSGPWRIQVQDDSGTFAKHALNLTVMNTGVAAVSASKYRGTSIIDPRSKSAINTPCKGVVAVMREAALANGLAEAVFVVGPEKGKKLLSKYAKGLIVNNSGRFIRTAGF